MSVFTLNSEPRQARLVIHIAQQTLSFYQPLGFLKQVYWVSTAKNGFGEQYGSEQTPRGWHSVCEKIGEAHPENAVFLARQFTGLCYHPHWATQCPERDWILTRILRLQGEEPGKNQGSHVDSYQRMIYIHGTPDSVPMGLPGSRGCIRMRNTDLMALFPQIAIGDYVQIVV